MLVVRLWFYDYGGPTKSARGATGFGFEKRSSAEIRTNFKNWVRAAESMRFVSGHAFTGWGKTAILGGAALPTLR